MDVLAFVVLFAALLAVLALMLLALVNLIGAAVGGRKERVALEYDLPQSSSTALRSVVEGVAPVMQGAGYKLVWEDTTVACFTRSYRPAWRIVLAILLAPLGLLLLLWATTDSLRFQLIPGRDTPRLAVNGTTGHRARDQVREAIAQFGDQRRIAGWYSDRTGQERYWDGDQWTDRTRSERIVVGPRKTNAPPAG